VTTEHSDAFFDTWFKTYSLS